MIWLAWLIIMFVNAIIITTIVDIVLMGSFTLKFSKKCAIPQVMISKDNRIDMQKGNQCSGYSTAYILRHYGIPANGDEVYEKMSNKMANGYVYPKEIKRMFEKYGFCVKYCVGNLHALKREVSKGNPVIVFIKVRRDKNWLHYVPVVGYDEEHVFLAESLAELVNCNEEVYYNRKISKKDFLRLWNTSMLKMPLYTHTFYVIEKKSQVGKLQSK